MHYADMERKRSGVWNHFTVAESDGSKVVCGICKAELMYSNSTGTMLNHLKSKHPGATASTAETVTSQRSMDAFTVRRNCPPSKSELITKSVADMIAIDLLPISMVKGAGFRDLMKLVEPEYAVPGRTQMTQRIEKRYVYN